MLNIPKVSVIVPNYNHASYLRQRLESIFNQTFKDFEVILLDDCSTDNSKEILTEYASNTHVSHLILNTVNSGNTFKQWKKGIAFAKGEWIWIAESDDFCSLTFLEKMLQYDTSKHIQLIAAESNVVDENGNFIVSSTEWNSRPENDYFREINGALTCENELVINNIFPNASALLIRKNDSLLTLDFEKSKRFGDWILWFNLLLKGNVVFVSEQLNSFRKHTTNVTPVGSGFARFKEETVKLLLEFNTLLKKTNIGNDVALKGILNWTFKDAPWTSSVTVDLNTWRNFLLIYNHKDTRKTHFLYKSLVFCIAHLIKGKIVLRK